MDEKKVNFKSIGRNILISFSLTILVVFILIILSKGGNFIESFFEIKPLYLIISFALVGLSWLLEAFQIIYCAKLLSINLSKREAINLALIGNFFSAVTPFSTGGQPFQMYLLNKNSNVEYGESAFFLLVKEIIAFIVRISLIIAIPIFVTFFKFEYTLPHGVNIAIDIGLIIYLLISILIILALFRTRKIADFIKKIAKKILPLKISTKVNEEIDKNVHLFEEGKRSLDKSKINILLLIFFLNLIQWLSSLFLPVVLLRGLGSNSPIFSIIFVTIVFLVSVVYVPTPGTSGAAEFGIALFFSSFLPRQPLIVFILLWRFFYYYINIIIGSFFVFKEFMSKRKKEKKKNL
ncbi:MAG TPA: lysylphosphatidylglycerol synthase transmembrane domain-containing protein [Caldisericia bacterium]|nr:lysylphosphatidylglycerol synthase transmembrane domain-containing protein [Caldisericia bacterium]HRT37368.1 lysylphosphatidylglycerol synthase transmembrane domain-containing protein [Caldisericia bacterium]HRU73937.1 lysylphosphatidylglycerol synthase transmembrane domain-containing protein [Caldisericia bacterium]